ncbi:hypothetical protein DFH09DRAFT_1271270 [Mycena vulgaris]|nr:hypothetical protein DFH09DRAFT_1271270 [Mycena vulgaris]
MTTASSKAFATCPRRLGSMADMDAAVVQDMSQGFDSPKKAVRAESLRYIANLRPLSSGIAMRVFVGGFYNRLHRNQLEASCTVTHQRDSYCQMHESLRLQLSRVPISLRRVVAAAANGSLGDLRALSQKTSRPDVSPSLALLFVSAFYANLDPTRIPDLQETPTPANMDQLERAMASIEGLDYCKPFIPVAAMLDLWAPYWAWIEFLCTFTAQSPMEEVALHALFISFVTFIGHFAHHEPFAKLAAATPGVRTFIARAWSALIVFEHSAERDVGFDNLLACMTGPMGASQPSGLDEYVEGAGGSIRDLATLVVRTIALLVPARSPLVSVKTIKFLRGTLHFVLETAHIHDLINKLELDAGAQVLSSALWERGLARVVTVVIDNLGDSTISAGHHVVDESFFLLRIAFATTNGRRWMAEAVQSGLLHAMLACGKQPPSNTVHRSLTFFLKTLLPTILVYYPVMREIDGALLDSKDVLATSPLAKTEMWRYFFDLAVERASVCKVVDSAVFLPRAACDNMQRGAIRDKNTLKRCSMCRSVYYCSRECQIRDWQKGRHRSVCTRRLALSLNEHQNLTWREGVLLRAVIQRDYEAHMARGIYPAQVRFLNDRPHEGFYTLFDYTTGRAQIEVQSLIHGPVSKRFRSEEWVSALERALDSEGRIELHVMRLVEAAEPRFLAYSSAN